MMPRHAAFRVLGLVLLLGLKVGVADDARPESRSLFDGKSLKDWKSAETYKPGPLKVEDGCLVLGAGGPMTSDVTTLTDIPRMDYELSFEAKRTSGGDFFAAATFPINQSYVTLVNGGWGGTVTGLSSLNGADASENETRQFVKYTNDTWYRFRIHVTGEVIRCWVDDKPVAGVAYEGTQLKTRVETRSCQPLGFASYRSTGLIREIKVRPLTKAEIKTDNAAVER